MKRRLLALLLTLTMLFSLMPAFSIAASAEDPGAIATVKIGESVKSYTDFTSAWADATKDGVTAATVTMLGDVTLTDTLNINDGKTVTVDLCGHVLKQDNPNAALNPKTIFLNKGNFTIKDSNPDGLSHCFVVDEDGVWRLDDSLTTVDYTFDVADGLKKNGEPTKELPKKGDKISVYGGCITGGTGHDETGYIPERSKGGAIYCFAGSLTIDGGSLVGNTAAYGGAICAHSANIDINNAAIVGNRANLVGGGLFTDQIDQFRHPGFFRDKFSFSFTGCQFSYNKSFYIAGFWSYEVTGGVSTFSSMFKNCVMRGNVAENGYGGFMYALSMSLPNLLFEDCIISQNRAEKGEYCFGDTGEGCGGAFALSNDNCLCVFNNVEISDNYAEVNGGAFWGYRFVEAQSTSYLNNCKISGNEAGESGGGVYLYGDHGGLYRFEVTGGEISDNKAKNGGGIYVNNGSVADITDCTLEGNTAKGNGSGMYVCDSTVSLAGNTKITENFRSDGKTRENVYLNSGKTLSTFVTTGSGETLSKKSITGMVGITHKDGIGKFTSNGAKTDEAYFFSDKPDYADKYDTGGFLALVQGYLVTEATCSNGSVSVGIAKSFYAGETVTITPKADDGYAVSKVYYQAEGDAKPTEITAEDGKYTFEMPAKAVTVSATFHKHDWTYANGGTGNENAVTATCSDADGEHSGSKTETLTISAPALTTYGGTESEKAILSATTLGEFTDLTVKYQKKNGAAWKDLTEAPTAAGEYKASVTVTKGSNSYTAFVTYTIAKAQVEVPTANTGLSYDGNQKTGVADAASTAAYTVSDNKQTNAGSYTAKAVLKDKANYEWKLQTPTSTDQEISWSIAKADPSVSTAPTAVQSLAYTGNAQNLVSGGSVTGGTIKYALGTDATNAPADTAFGTNVPTGKDADTYYVWYKVFGDNNHNDNAAACITNSIAKSDQTISVPTLSSATTTSITLNAITGGYGKVEYAMNTSNITPTTGWSESTTFTGLTMNTAYYFFARFAGDDNHNGVTSTGAAISTPDHEHSWEYTASGNVITATCSGIGAYNYTGSKTLTLSASNVTYDGTAKIASISESSIAGQASLPAIDYEKWNDNDGKWNALSGSPVDAGRYRASIKITFGEKNDRSAVAYKSFEIAKRELCISSASASKDYDGTALVKNSFSVTSGSFVSGEGVTCSYTGTQTNAGSSENTFSYSFNNGTESGNYSITKINGTLTVNKASIADADVALGTVLVYNGNTQTQSVVSVKVGELVLSESDYRVSGNTAKDIGKHSLTVTAAENGNFKGSKIIPFEVFAVGKAEFTTESNGIDMTLNMDKTAAVLAVAEPAELDSLNGNPDILNIQLVVTEIDPVNVLPDAKTKIINLVDSSNKKLCCFVDLSLYKWMNDDVENKKPVSQTNSPMTIVIDIDKEKLGDHKNFWVVRYHDGEASILDGAYDIETNKLTVTTDKFSDYAIVCSTPSTVNTIPTVKTELVYNGKNQVLVNDGSVSGGNFVYSFDNISFSAELPAKKSSGTYKIYYKAVGDENHDEPMDSCSGSFEVQIEKTDKMELTILGDAEARHTDVKTYTADFVGNRPEGSYVVWSVFGKCAVRSGYTGDSITVMCDDTGSFTLTARLVDKNGRAIKDADGKAVTDSMKVNVKIKTGDFINIIIDAIMRVLSKYISWIKVW